MEHCVIFCAGGFSALAEPIPPGSLVIAADGGLRHTQALGLTAHMVLGDFDSLGQIPAGAEVYPVEKDDTDAMLAIKRGLALGCRRFTIYGGLDGKRLDHTIANLQALLYLAEHDAVGTLVGNDFVIQSLRNDGLTFPGHFFGIFSLFCLGADARQVEIRGAKYNLENGVLTAGFPLGVSNHFLGKPVTVRVGSGTVLLLWDRVNGLLQDC